MLIQTPKAPSQTRKQPVLSARPLQRKALNSVEMKYLAADTNQSPFLGPQVKSQREKLLKEIVSDTHYTPIASICKKKNYTLSIRETGLLSIHRIKQGAKAKPHSILEKTIKKSSLDKVYKEDGQKRLEQAKELDIDGFVGHWDGDNLIGLRADNPDPEIMPWLQEIQPTPGAHQPTKKPYYVPVDLNAPGGGYYLSGLKNQSRDRWQTFLYTGDYDLHEAYKNHHQIVEATQQKVDLLNNLNKSIADSGVDVIKREGKFRLAGNEIKPVGNTDYAMFQHGDQATYRMNQLLEHGDEPGKAKLVKAVAEESDEPMAWCKNGYWFVTKNKKEHAELRQSWGLTTPHTWEQSEIDKIANNQSHTVEHL